MPPDADPSLVVRLSDGAVVGGDRDAFAIYVAGAAHVVHRNAREIVGLADGRILATLAACRADRRRRQRVAAVLDRVDRRRRRLRARAGPPLRGA